MKVCVYYVTKNHKVVDEKQIMENVGEVGKGVVCMVCPLVAMPILKEAMPMSTGIVAHAMDTDSSLIVSDAFKPLISTVQDLAEPISYGMSLKGFYERMTGKKEEGKATIMNSFYCFVGIQFLPDIYKLLKLVKLS